MPTISEAIKAGKKAKSALVSPEQPVANPEPVIERPRTPSPPASPTVSGLPTRGLFTPDLTLATEFDNAGPEFTKGINLRSKVFPYPIPIVSTLATLEAQAATNIASAKTNALGATAKSASQAANNASKEAASANSNAVVAITSAGSAQTTANTANTTANTANTTATALNVVPISTMAASGDVDSTQSYFNAADGSIVPQVVSEYQNLFSYTSTSSTITISWPTFTLYYASGASRTINSNSQTFSGLTTSVIYYFYCIAIPGSNFVHFVNVTGGVGSPAWLYTPQSPAAAQAMYNQGVTALANGGVACSPTGGSGGGGGSGLCVRDSMFVQENTKGLVRIDSCKPGDWLLSRHGWTEIKQLKILHQNKFIRVTTEMGYLDITATHHITTADDESKAARDLTLSDMLIGSKRLLPIKSLELLEEEGYKVILSCEPEHVFFCGNNSAHTLASNNVPLS